MTELGIIAIGRNEGDRLQRCLASVAGGGRPVVYVDSNSSDGSAEMARAMGVEVVDLDLSVAFSAARARNAGCERLLQQTPHVKFIFFVDGDCEVVEGWLDEAVREIKARPGAAAVCGRRRERRPEASVYNRLADVEWNTPIGEARSCGGDALYRVEAFEQAGRFDPTVVAGEEPELCQRLRAKGWKIYRIDAEMTLHDSAMLRFAQWWKRTIRSGYGAMDVATRFRSGRDGLFVRQVDSARFWAITLPLAVLLAFSAVGLIFGMLAGVRLGLTAGCIAAISVLTLIPLQMLRLAIKARRRVGDWRTALAYGVLTVLGKFAHFTGQVRYTRDRAVGKNTRLIDYKAAGAASPVQTDRVSRLAS